MSTPIDHEPVPEDRELDALLSRSGRVHAAWREASVEEPPAALDDAIRAAARRAVRAGPRPAGATFVSRWRVPMSIAAVLVVSATLTLLLSERGEHLPGTDLRRAPVAPNAATEADATARHAAKAAAGDERLRSEATAPAREQATPPMADVSGPLAKQRQAAAPESRLLAQEGKKKARRENETAARGDVQSPREPRTDSISTRDARAKAQTQAGAPADSAAPPAASIVAAHGPADEAEGAANQALRAAPVAAAPLPAKPAASAAEERTIGRAERAAPEQAESSKRDAPAPPASRVEPAAAPGAGTSEVTSASAAPAGVESASGQRESAAPAIRQAQQVAVAPALEPKAWVERILALRRQGKVQEAQRSLEEFRRRHPDYPLPPELAALLKAPPAD